MWRRLLQHLLYLLGDFLATYAVWLLFVVLRRQTFDEVNTGLDPQQFINAFIISICWVLLYMVSGLYQKPFRRSRLQEFIQVFKTTLLGVLILFFAIFLDDKYPPEDPSVQRILLATYLALQFGAVAIVRFFITTRTNLRIRRRKIGFPTLLVGCKEQALRIYGELEGRRRSLGYQFKGYVSLNGSKGSPLRGKLKHLGVVDRLAEVIQSRKIEEVIIALEAESVDKVPEVIGICERSNVYIKVVPGVYDFIVGSVKVSHMLGEPLIEVFPQIMKPWERVIKRGFDVVVSIFSLVVLSPLYLALALTIRMDSVGPIFFRQERIGKYGEPFMIVKFRTMYQNAEQDGPALSSEDDPRITKVGYWLRKTRLDELPQFWNVLKGEMSIVGPRPERQYYIDQIVKIAPHYQHLHKIRPGITSWGQVKYGYASNVEEMLERLKFDILYMENMSLALDFKILLYTLIVIIEGRGK